MLRHPRASIAARVLLIGLCWAALFLPSLERRALHFEEGRHALAARDVQQHGHWLLPEVYGVRFVEKPPLFPLMIAAGGWIRNDVDVWAVRFAPLLAVLLCAYLVLFMTASRASPLASLVAVGCWFLNPEVLNKARVGEPDIINATFVFAAFVVWWSGVERGRVTVARWIGCGLLLAGAALTKGPQHVAYFALGVLGAMILARSWRDLPGYAIAVALPGVCVCLWGAAVYQPGDERAWLAYMRFEHQRLSVGAYAGNLLEHVGKLALVLLPGCLLAVPFWRDTVRTQTMEQRHLGMALLLYAVPTTLIVIFWPGTSSRYALPAFPAVAVAAGLMVDDLRTRHTRYLVGATMAMLAGAALYQLALVVVVMPRWPYLFNRNQRIGQSINAVVATDAAPLWIAANDFHNVVYYLDAPVRLISPRDVALLPASWLIAARSQTQGIRALRTADVVFENDEPAFAVFRLDHK